MAEAKLTPHEILQKASRAKLGYNPFYGAIKPVHIANGFFSAVLGGYYDTDALNDVARLWERLRRYDPKTTRPFDHLVSSYPVWEEEAAQPKAVTSLSAVLMAAYGADDALFSESQWSSLTTASRWGVTGDPTHRKTGDFLLWLITQDLTDDDAETLRWLRDLLDDATDPWTLVALPLLQCHQQWHDRTEAGSNTAFVPTRTTKQLQQCFKRLLRFERRQQTKLSSLRRVILFGCFAVYLDLLSRLAEQSPPEEAIQPPILIDADGGPSVRAASHDSFRAAQQTVERYFRTIVAEYLTTELGADPSNPESLDAIRELLSRGDREFNPVYDAFSTVTDPFERLVRAVVFRGFAESVNTPTAFMRELGRRAGLLGPWSGRGDRKRYRVTPDFLEVLVLATLEQGETLYFDVFLDRLLENFGIVVGRDRDVETIRRNNIYATPFGVPTFVNEDELRENKDKFKKQLQELGYAISYADGVTIVRVP